MFGESFHVLRRSSTAHSEACGSIGDTNVADIKGTAGRDSLNGTDDTDLIKGFGRQDVLLDAIVHRRGGLIEAEVDGELVALHVENGTCYGFNGTATQIWAMVAEPRSVLEIRNALVAQFDVDPQTCAVDLRALLAELEADGLVELRPA